MFTVEKKYKGVLKIIKIYTEQQKKGILNLFLNYAVFI